MVKPTREESIGPFVVEVLQFLGGTLTLIIQILVSIILSIVTTFTKKPKSVKGEIVLITGAGHGMGEELAYLYAAEGATVVIWDINQENGEKVVRNIQRRGHPKAHFYLCDVSNRENVLEIGKKTQKEVGDVTILINNAGIMPTHPILDHTEKEIRRIIDINLTAHFWTLEAFLPTMKKNNYGHIVCLSSCAGLYGIANLVPYCATKFAVRGLMEALRAELRADKKNEINFTTICPFMVDTGLCKKPFIRFQNLMPIVKVDEAAKEIINAQRLDLQEISIPRYYSRLNNIMRFLPARSQDFAMDALGVGLYSDLN